MVATFCLRLALGMMACLQFLPASQVPARFFRVHFLTALGLTGVALAFSLEHELLYGSWLLTLLVLFFGSVVWRLEGAPLGRAAALLATGCLLLIVILHWRVAHDRDRGWALAEDLTSAAVLGSALTAMLIGHSYLLAPGMTLTPLLRMLLVLSGSLVLRAAAACVLLWDWTRAGNPFADTETMLWLAVRWLLGLLAPLVLGWMAWETARIRSTQSATGILYVVVMVCFLGELTSQLLFRKAGYIL